MSARHRTRSTITLPVPPATVSEAQMLASREFIDQQRMAYLQENSRAVLFDVFGHAQLQRAARNLIYGAHHDAVTGLPQLFWWISLGCISSVHHTALDVVMRFEETDAGLAMLRLMPWCVANDVNADSNSGSGSDSNSDDDDDTVLYVSSPNPRGCVPAKNNTSGIIGVRYNAPNNAWRAHVGVDGKTFGKSFSVSVHGEQAKENAIAWRRAKAVDDDDAMCVGDGAVGVLPPPPLPRPYIHAGKAKIEPVVSYWVEGQVLKMIDQQHPDKVMLFDNNQIGHYIATAYQWYPSRNGGEYCALARQNASNRATNVFAHRVVFEHYHGTPSFRVSHVNGNHLDNRVANLRMRSRYIRSKQSAPAVAIKRKAPLQEEAVALADDAAREDRRLARRANVLLADAKHRVSQRMQARADAEMDEQIRTSIKRTAYTSAAGVHYSYYRILINGRYVYEQATTNGYNLLYKRMQNHLVTSK